MAYVTHLNGDQLPSTRAKAQANFEEVVATRAEVDAEDLIVVGSGMGLIQFRDVCRINFETIAGLIAGDENFEVIDDGDMLWDVRDKLNANFGIIAGIV